MNPTQQKAVSLKRLGLIYPACKLDTKEAALAWLDALHDVTPDELDVAVRQVIQTGCGGDFPRPHDLRQLALEAREGGGLEPAASAWAAVKAAVTTIGWTGVPTFEDPHAEEAIHSLGWREFCASPIEDEPSWRARFIQFYEQFRKRALEENLQSDDLRARIAAVREEAQRRVGLDQPKMARRVELGQDQERIR